MVEHNIFIVPSIATADLAAKRYVDSKVEKTLEGLTGCISDSLQGSPLTPKQKIYVTEIVAEDYKGRI